MMLSEVPKSRARVLSAGKYMLAERGEKNEARATMNTMKRFCCNVKTDQAGELLVVVWRASTSSGGVDGMSFRSWSVLDMTEGVVLEDRATVAVFVPFFVFSSKKCDSCSSTASVLWISVGPSRTASCSRLAMIDPRSSRHECKEQHGYLDIQHTTRIEESSAP